MGITQDRLAGLSSSSAWKGPCRVATAANIALQGEQTIDGVAVVANDRVLVVAQTDATQNGIYYADTGPWTRAADFNRTDDVIKGTRVAVTDGSGAGSYRVTSANPIIVGESNITFLHVEVTGLYPEDFGAVGDGVTIDDDAIEALVDASSESGIPMKGAPGKNYRCSSTPAFTLRTPFDRNGSKFTVPNDGQNNPLFYIDSAEDDIETVSLATMNGLTGLKRYSKKIPELTERDWAYLFYSTDDVIYHRSIGGNLAYGESFVVTDDQGTLDKPLVRTYATPFTNMTCARRKMRDWMKMDLLVEVVDGSGDAMNRVVVNRRPKTYYKPGSGIINTSTTGKIVLQGFVDETSYVTYDHPIVFGLNEVSQQYGFNSAYSNSITWINPLIGQCRRGIDAHGSKYLLVIGGSLPNGAGGHWVDGLKIHMASIGHRAYANPRCIQAAGSNIELHDCDIHVSAAGPLLNLAPQVMCMRSDIPEWSGTAIVRGGSVTVYDNDNTIETGKLIELMKFNSHDPFNYVRSMKLPEYIEFKPDILRQVGADSNNTITILALGCPQNAASVPSPIELSGRVKIEPGSVFLEAGDIIGGFPRLKVNMYRGETQVGAGMDVSIKGIETVAVYCAPFSANMPDATGRFRITIEDTGPLSTYDIRPGAAEMGRLEPSCAYTADLSRASAAEPFGDEAIDFVAIGDRHPGLALNPFGGILQRGNNFTTADGAYGPDGWIGLAESGTVESGSAADEYGFPSALSFVQKDALPKKIGCVSFIDSSASVALRDRLVTMVASLMLTVDGTMRYAILEWEGTANFPTRDPINDWGDDSLLPGDFFVGTGFNVLTTGSIALEAASYAFAEPLPAHVGEGCNNLAMAFWTDAALAQDQYFRLAADIYPGFARPLARRRSVSEELERCFPWYRKMNATTINGKQFVPLGIPMIKTPAVNASVGAASAPTVDGCILTHTVDAVATALTFAADI